MYKLKFTKLQNEILRFLFIKFGESFNLRRMAQNLSVSLTAVAKALKGLEKEELVVVKKDPESKRLSIKLNEKNSKVFFLKRVENLRLIYESGLVEVLSETFPGATIILFGSYAFGEDTVNSDIDIAVIGYKEREVNLSKFNKKLDRVIILHFYEDFRKINKNLKVNIFNGITLAGAIKI